MAAFVGRSLVPDGAIVAPAAPPGRHRPGAADAPLRGPGRRGRRVRVGDDRRAHRGSRPRASAPRRGPRPWPRCPPTSCAIPVRYWRARSTSGWTPSSSRSNWRRASSRPRTTTPRERRPSSRSALPGSPGTERARRHAWTRAIQRRPRSFAARVRAFLRDNLPEGWQGIGAIADRDEADAFVDRVAGDAVRQRPARGVVAERVRRRAD